MKVALKILLFTIIISCLIMFFSFAFNAENISDENDVIIENYSVQV